MIGKGKFFYSALLLLNSLVASLSAWTLPENLTPPLAGIDHPQVKLNEEKAGIAIWGEFFLYHSEQRAEIIRAATFAQGKWSAAATLSETARYTSHPQIALNAKNNVVAIWVKKVSDHPSSFIIQGASLNSFESKWRRTTDLNSTPFFDVEPPSPQIAIDPMGNAMAVWRAGSEIQAASLTSRSKEWSKSRKISDNEACVGNPCIAVDKNGNFLTVWQGLDSSGSGRIQSKILFIKDLSSFSKVTLSDAGDDAINPQLSATSEGKAVVVWEKNQSKKIIQAKFLSFNEKKIKKDRQTFDLSSSTIHSQHASVALNKSGEAIATWESHPYETNPVIVALVYREGTWHKEEELSYKNQENASHPQISMDEASNAVVVWQQDDPFSLPGIQEATYHKGNWSWPIQISAPGEAAHAAQVSVSGFGQTLAVWSKVLFKVHSESFKVMQASFKEIKD